MQLGGLLGENHGGRGCFCQSRFLMHSAVPSKAFVTAYHAQSASPKFDPNKCDIIRLCIVSLIQRKVPCYF